MTARRLAPLTMSSLLMASVLLLGGCLPNYMTNPNGSVDGRRVPPLHRAAMSGNVSQGAKLLDRGADIEATFDRGVTYYAERFHDGVAQEGDQGLPVIHVAVEAKEPDFVRLLLERGARTDSRDALGRSPLMMAANVLATDSARVLIEFGADVNEQYEDTTVLMMAVVSASVMKAAQDAFAREYRQRSGVGVVTQKDVGEAFVKLLIDSGARVDATNQNGDTALHFAAAGGMPALVELLLDNGAPINARGREGKTPLDLADENNKLLAAELLRQRGGINSN